MSKEKTNVFEEKNIPKAIMRVGLPAMLGTLTTLIYNMADTYFVSMTKEPAMIAAVTLCTPILLIVMSIAVIFGMGGSSLIARLIGEDKKGEAAKAMNFCTVGMIAAGILVLIVGLLFRNGIAGIAGADEQNFAYTMDYLKWVFIGAPAIMLSNGFVHLFRSEALIKQSTVGLVIGNGTNIVLDYVFIVRMGLGTAGAAAATSIGFVFSTIYYLVVLYMQEKKGNELVGFGFKYISFDPAIVKGVISIGIPGALITVLLSVGNIVLNNFIGIYGSDAVAAYGIAYKLDLVPIMLSVGLSQGISPLIGYYYGGGKGKEMKEGMLYGTIDCILLGIFFVVMYVLFGKALSGIFLHDEELIAQASMFIRNLAISAPMLGIINMVTNYFQALGKGLNSMIITLMRNAILFIPGVMILNAFFGLSGVISAQPVVETLLSIICIIMFLIDFRKVIAGMKH